MEEICGLLFAFLPSRSPINFAVPKVAIRAPNVNMPSKANAWFALTAMRLHKLWRPFGEVQQDLLLSCLTIGQAYCLLKVLQ